MAQTLPGPPLPLRPGQGLTLRFTLAGGVSLVAWILLHALAPPARIGWTPEMNRAAERMAEGLVAVAEHCRSAGIEVDPGMDPNGTCLVGPETTPLFTTLGQPEAKRTTFSPDVAALLVHLLREAGVEPGEPVAVGASGSFPGLLLATLTAVEAVGARPVTILSLGASSWGATRPDFHLLDLHRVLLEAGVVATPPVAVSLGGAGDVGGEFDPLFRASLLRELHRAGVPVLEEPELPANVARRMTLYRDGGEPAAFVNLGGSDATLGTSPRILEVPPGLSERLADEVRLPPPGERGVIFAMGEAGVPVIHLLNLRGLALRHALPWDPVPLPAPGSTRLLRGEKGGGWPVWLLTGAYALALLLVAAWPRPFRRPP